MSRYAGPAPEGIAATIRRARESAGWSQDQLADLVGHNRTKIVTFEGGHGVASSRVLDAIAGQFGCRWELVPLEGDDAET